MNELDELRALVREVIRDVLPKGLPVTETVNLSTDQDLAAFVNRLLDVDPDQREELRSGRKRFRLAAPPASPVPAAAGRAGPASAGPASAGSGSAGSGSAGSVNGAERAGESTPVRRIERGAVTEAVVTAAARAGERLVLGRGAVLTPLARDRARASGVPIEKER
jgi:hypothetical protein